MATTGVDLSNRLRKLTDRQMTMLVHYLRGRYYDDPKFEGMLEDGVRWLEGGQSDGRQPNQD
jgi:hypothetical protein